MQWLLKPRYGILHFGVFLVAPSVIMAVAGYTLAVRLVMRSPLPAVAVAAERATVGPCAYAHDYEFGVDFFSRNVPVWTEIFQPYAGKPGVNYLEVGALEGRSAFWMIENVLTDPTSRMTVVDIFAGPYKDRYFANLGRCGAADRVTTITGFSQVVLRGLPLESFDIIYIDGSHVARDVLEDAVLSWRLLKPGGLMIFDDYQELNISRDEVECPKKAIDPFVQCFADKCEVLHNGYQLVIRKNTDV